MKLPWVSRAAYDAMHVRAERAELVSGAANRDALLAAERAREAFGRAQGAEAHAMAQATLLDSVLTKYHQLKLQGFTLPVEPRAPQSTVSALIDKVNRAIDSAPASRDPKNRAAMWAQVESDRANGVSEEEIVMRIRRGNRPAEESA